MRDTTETWRDYAHLLTPQQVAYMDWCEANPTRWEAMAEHRDPGHHRRGLCGMAKLYSVVGPGGMN